MANPMAKTTVRRNPFKLIYADPPWEHVDVGNGLRSLAKEQYPCMSLRKLKKLPIQNIADDNSVLALWTTYPKLEEALEVMRSWGFVYTTVLFTWVKTNPKSGTIFMGLGFYTRSNAEIVLLGKRGKGVKRLSASVRQIVVAPRGRHSAKPPVVRKRLEQLFGDVRRIELFARERVNGWHAWGNEI